MFGQLSLCLTRERAEAATCAMFRAYGTMGAIFAAPEAELAALAGVEAPVAEIIAKTRVTLEAFRSQPLRDVPVLNAWDRLEEYVLGPLTWQRREVFRVLFLNTRNHLIADEAMGEGTVNHVPVYPREIVRRAVMLDATALILVHNHPSGDPRPSRADVEMTAEIRAAVEAVGIVLHDHLIVGQGRCVSLRREGLI